MTVPPKNAQIMKNLLFVLFLFAISTFFHSAQAQQTGHVSDPALGLAFDIPSGWVGQLSGDYFIIGHQSIPGMIILSMHQSNVNQLKQEAKKGLHDPDNSVALQLSGNIQDLNKHTIAGMLEGTVNWQAAKAYFISMANPNGNGISIAVLVGKELFDQKHIDIAHEIMRSVKFTKPQTAGIKNEWETWLANTRVQYLNSNYSPSYTSGGISAYSESKEKIDLCAAGYFIHYSFSMVSAGNAGMNGYSGGQNGGQGNWEIQVGAGGTPSLILKFNDGTIREYELSYEDKKLYLNGRRYFRTKTGDESPACY